MKEATKTKDVEELISKFKKRIFDSHGIKLTILTPADDIYRLTIPETADIVNKHLLKYNFNNKKKSVDLQNKSRRDDRVLHHQVFCKICKDMNYTLTEIGRYLDKDHSTIIYSIRRATDMIYINDNRFLTVYNSVKKQVINELENGRDIQYTTEEGINSKSALHVTLSEA